MRKQEIVAELLLIPRDQFETIADLASEPTAEKEASEIALACFHQGRRKISTVNTLKTLIYHLFYLIRT